MVFSNEFKKAFALRYVWYGLLGVLVAFLFFGSCLFLFLTNNEYEFLAHTSYTSYTHFIFMVVDIFVSVVFLFFLFYMPFYTWRFFRNRIRFRKIFKAGGKLIFYIREYSNDYWGEFIIEEFDLKEIRRPRISKFIPKYTRGIAVYNPKIHDPIIKKLRDKLLEEKNTPQEELDELNSKIKFLESQAPGILHLPKCEK